MKIFAETVQENGIIKEFNNYIREKYNITPQAIDYEDRFALVYWSIKDLNEIEKATNLSEEKINFLIFAEEKMCDKMIENGWECMEYLLNEYCENI